MKKLIPAIICLFACNSIHAQIKGDPQIKGTFQQLTPSKFSSRLSPELKRLYEKYGSHIQSGQLSKGQSSSADALENIMMIKGGKVLVDFTIKDDVAATKAELKKKGVTITASFGRVLSGLVPINVLQQIETTTSVQYAKPAYKPIRLPVSEDALDRKIVLFPPQQPQPSVVHVTSQGDTAQLSYLARKKYHVNGAGVKVGIISDSYNHLGTAATGIAHGELPGPGNPFGYIKPVQVLEDADSDATDEGRQMLEVVHDVAPGAELAFHTGNNSAADFAQGIQDLASAGCRVIADDVAYFDDPYFQDGIISQSIDSVKKRGVAYFTAAGNFSLRSYEYNYQPTSKEPFGAGMGTAHNFSAPGDSPRYTQPLLIRPGAAMILQLQWSQSSFAASGVGCTSDLDIYLTDTQGNVVSSSTSDNLKSGEPMEAFGYTNKTTDSIFFIVILKYAGPDPASLKYVLYDYNSSFYITTPAIPGLFAPTIVGHEKADGAISVGAAAYFQTPPYGVDTPVVEHFSSVGGVANYFDVHGNAIPPVVRQKPEIVAPDNANVSFSYYGGTDIPQDADAYPNFKGTSAAAPHAAGVAALMIQAQKLNTLTPDQVKEALEETATDMDNIYTAGFDKGFDFNTGYGLINAEKAVDKVKFSYLYVRDLRLVPLCSNYPDKVRRWKIINPNPFAVNVDWYVDRSGEHGTLAAPPGDTSFTTTTVTFQALPVPNVAVISWRDNFFIYHTNAKYSTKCGPGGIGDDNSDKLISSPPGSEDSKINVANVFPNPSLGTFRLYLSFAGMQPADIELYSTDGKKLQSEIIKQSNGVFDINAAGYKPGIYLLHITRGNFVKTIKLVKE